MGSVQSLLSGETAFYNHPDLVEKEMLQKSAPAPCYSYNTTSRIWQIARRILLVILLPIGISLLTYRIMQWTAACCGLLPAVALAYLPKCICGDIHGMRARLAPSREWTTQAGWYHKRISIEVDGQLIDCLITGKSATLQNGRWMITSTGNGESYETRWGQSYYRDFGEHSMRELLKEIDCNAISFNCPGVMGSSGVPNKETITKASRAVLKFVEEGLKAEKIVWYGYSMGGAIQAAALNNHQPKEGVKYCFIKDRTFSNLADAADGVAQDFLSILPLSRLIAKLVKLGVKLLGWNFDSVSSSKTLKEHEIIIQTVRKEALLTDFESDYSYTESGYTYTKNDYTESVNPETIESDGMITKEASLAYALLTDPTCPKEKKHFIGIGGWHGTKLRKNFISFLGQKIHSCLDEESPAAVAATA